MHVIVASLRCNCAFIQCG